MAGKRNKGKTAKRAGVEGKTKREALGRKATDIGKPVAKTQAKAMAKTEVKANAVAEVKAVSKKKIVIEKKERAPANFSPKVENEATQVSRCRSVAKVSAKTKSMCKDKAGIDTCAGEETNVGSRFWNREETNNSSSAKDEDKADTGPPSCAEKLKPVASASYKATPGAEEEEEDNVIGNWFWDGDETSFDPDPKPVSRIVRPLLLDEINEKDRPKDWSEVTIWPNAPAVTPAVLGYRSQSTSETKSQYIVLGSPEEKAPVLPEDPEGSKSIVSCSEPLPEHPFGTDPCIQTIEEIRRQIKIREMNGIKPFACPCKMECYMNSEEFEQLVVLLESTTDPLIHKVAQIAMGVVKVHPFAQDFINEVGIVTLVESLLTFPPSDTRKNAEITVNNPTGDERLRRVELHVKHMCKETMCFPLNSPGQQSGLKILGQLTTDMNRHHIVACYLSDLFYLISQGNRKTRNLALKVLLNMSENPVAARDMIDIKALAALKLLFNQKEAKANLVSTVAIFINIKEHIRKGTIVVVDHSNYNTLMDIFREVKAIIQKL
ncbi:protein BHLHb9 [Pipistrellus kuhlii]|uniref:Basic helix-loop-helix family member b9 n=1 Tax=Pipistrellus kuhlii TaxID=59472 RepID=A0A7J7V639_PIPKU|nr:protein BHLHb9 [Pipistrellus kuhlii]XP_036295850.1 protein BHLHb9 [Pipistrellus kuhlii]XP_036295852.1 protein BHLHb9 [Pipistrellus kuhlii]XP_045438358.1 protein BHLHb9 [Pipistrellus kuhlii]XP_045438359.1 protein BHLHb9 [Pipistrellus kuhlii]KAF6320446.1 basic helix-loop-helix family member b9 [Pipistrellus kuhlii]